MKKTITSFKLQNFKVCHYLRFILILVPLLSNSELLAQDEDKYTYRIKKTKEAIKLDGDLNEIAWQNAQEAKDFFLVRPFDTSFASLQTVVRMTFDDNFLYVGAVCFEPRKLYTMQSLRRDFDGGTSDIVTINIDTFKDRVNGFHFAINPFNVQREGLISMGEDLSNVWDNKWYSQVKNYDDRWVVEVAIPFKTLRYKIAEGENSWHINFGRNVMQTNEVSVWKPVPRNFRPHNLAFAGNLIWDENPPKAGTNIALIPYISGGYAQDFPRKAEDLSKLPSTNTFTGAVGMDAKVAVTPSLNLDLTINPDFSQVEVDRQVTNLSRFELFFPERRQFFIENSDLFSTFGFPDTRPFFSRRIGITRNPNTGLNQQVPILAGARLSGKLNDNWRVGFLNMQTRKVKLGDNEFLPNANYTVATLQRKVFERSFIGGIFANKENFLGGLSETQRAGYRQFNRVAGLEFNYYSKDNRGEAETYYHQSFYPNAPKDAASLAQYVGYHHPNIDLNFALQRIGKNYVADIGFVPRRGIVQTFRPMSLILNPKNEKTAKYINSFGINFEGNDVFDIAGLYDAPLRGLVEKTIGGKRLDSETSLSLFLNTPAGGEAYMGHNWVFTHLFFPFEPTNSGDSPNPDLQNAAELPIGDYKWRFWSVGFETSQRNDWSGSLDFNYGGYFTGRGSFTEGSVSYRWQPYGTISLDLAYTRFNFDKPLNSVRFLLLGPRAELSFSRSVFFSTFFQYNTQTNNVNINSRLQWRYKPVSDFFLVYTDNYFAEAIPRYGVSAWMPKNRALILKMTYWLNI
ncbi:MAG: carbohydrate binding family 9 domain-containing protein [Spirosomaceae bacterium]|nr:carbohydrate binding family 9 domain-containing protein [Spirosomataceae bacterium]